MLAKCACVARSQQVKRKVGGTKLWECVNYRARGKHTKTKFGLRSKGGRHSLVTPWAKEGNPCNAPELFATIPPIETSEYLLRRAARDSAQNMMHVDVTLVDFYADASGDMSARRPIEEQDAHEHDICGQAHQYHVRGPRRRAELATQVRRDCAGARLEGRSMPRQSPEVGRFAGLSIGTASSSWALPSISPASWSTWAARSWRKLRSLAKVTRKSCVSAEPHRLMYVRRNMYEGDHRHAGRLIEGVGLTSRQSVATLVVRESRKARRNNDENHGSRRRRATARCWAA